MQGGFIICLMALITGCRSKVWCVTLSLLRTLAPSRGFPAAPSCSLLWGLPCLGQEGLSTGQGHFAGKQRLANTHTGLSQGSAADFWGHPPADPHQALGDPSRRRSGEHSAVRKS